MKKKVFLVVTCLLLVALCLVGCADYSEQFAKINRLLNASYSKINLTVTVTKGSDSLASEFIVVYDNDNSSTIQFTVKRFATFPNDGTSPDSYIETYQGFATVKGSTITSVSGDVPEDVDFASVDGRSISFNQNFFTNIKVDGNSITAKVTKPQAFLGQLEFVCKSDTMVMAVEFHDRIDYVRIQYTSVSGATVVMMYNFTK